MYKWLLFDADNTLFDFNKAEAKSFHQTCTHFQIPFTPQTMATYKVVNHETWEKFEKGAFPASQINQYRFGTFFQAIGYTGDPEQFGEHYLYELGQCPDLLDGADTLVERLAKQFRLGIVTNGLKNVQRSRFKLSSITHHFDPIIISEEVGVTKPDPAIFEIAFAHMGSPEKAEVLMIGDSLSSDMQGGINFGIDTCWYNPHQKQNSKHLPITHEIHDLAELPERLGVSC